MTAYEALLLDFGGVVARTLFECQAEIEQCLGLPSGSFCWRGPLDPANDALWRATLSGAITEQEYWRRCSAELSRLIGRPVTTFDVVGRIFESDPNRLIRPEAAALVRRLKAAGHRVGLLSNDLERVYGRPLLSRIEILGDMDCVVDGSWSRLHKPAPEAYASALAALGSRAERVVFVDDQPGNVTAASALGMIGLNFDICAAALSFARVERCFWPLS
jgi:putative hydrolase of the HAD superfamily